MFEDKDLENIHKVLLRVARDSKAWNRIDTGSTSKALAPLGSTESTSVPFSLSWYNTLEKNIRFYIATVLELETMESNYYSFQNEPVDYSLNPFKMKQLIITKLIAEMGRTANELKRILRCRSGNSALGLRRRIRWLELKLELLCKRPLMPSIPRDETNIWDRPSPERTTLTSSVKAFTTTTPTFIVSTGSGDDDPFRYSSGSETESTFAFDQGLGQRTSTFGETSSPDAAEAYWRSEHHQVDVSPLPLIMGQSLPYHTLDIQRSDSYVKEKGDPTKASLPWKYSKNDYVDPDSEEKQLERLSVTVQQLMGRAYEAALESIPTDTATRMLESDLLVDKKPKKKRSSGGILANIKGQKWMEKKFRHSLHSKNHLVYYPLPELKPQKYLLAKLSDDTYPPLPSSVDPEIFSQRAQNMPVRFINQHDLIKKTQLTLFDLLYDANKIKSKVDMRRGSVVVKQVTKVEAPVAPSASLLRQSEPTPVRPKSPKAGTTLTIDRQSQARIKRRKGTESFMKDGTTVTPRRLPHGAQETTNDSSDIATRRNRVYMTKSGWHTTRRMKSPMQYVSLRLQRAKDLLEKIKTESLPEEQRISGVKQLAGLGVSNSDIVYELQILISSSQQRTGSMDLRFEILKFLLMLGITDNVVLKELLVFLSTSNYQVLCDLLRVLRKALNSSKNSKPFGKNSDDGTLAGPILKEKPLNLLYVSPTDGLILHRLVQLSQSAQPELSFYAVSCLRKVKVMPPPPPLQPELVLTKQDSLESLTEEDKAAIQAHEEYGKKLEEYQLLVKDLNKKEEEIRVHTKTILNKIAKSQTPIVVDALQELIEYLGDYEPELFRIAYDLITHSPSAGIRASLIRLIANAFYNLVNKSSTDTITELVDEFQIILTDRLVNDTDKKVTNECATAYLKLGLYDKMTEYILNNLDNKLDFEIKMEAIKCALGLRIRGSVITRALVDLLELDPSEGVRIAACRALAEVGASDRRALAALREKHERHQGVVAREAGRALAALTSSATKAATSTSNSAVFNPDFLGDFINKAVKT